MQVRSLAFGLPRLGPEREYKGLLEGYWSGKKSREELKKGLESLEARRLEAYRAHVDLYPVGEMSLYDPLLDLAVMTGIYPIDPGDPEAYYALARGREALPLRKWFGTNYHYLSPRLPERPSYRPHWNKSLEAYRRHPEGLPHLLGPYTLLRLAQNPPEDPRTHLEALAQAYAHFLAELREAGAPMALLEEPALGLDGAEAHLAHLEGAYRRMLEALPLVLLTPYLSPRAALGERLYALPWRGVSLDPKEVAWEHLPRLGPTPVLQVVEGQGVWRTPLLELAERIGRALEGGAKEVWLAPRAPLYHLPWAVGAPPMGLQGRLAFALERLHELSLLSRMLRGEEAAWEEARAWRPPGEPPRFPKPTLPPSPRPPREERVRAQKDLALPPFPTTTIGSFPQTQDLRALRAKRREGKVGEEAYQEAIRQAIARTIRFQEELGLDVLVHGEPERSDMVEFFAERLEGFYTHPSAWVLSYGSRVYRPPILAGPVRRRRPLVLEELRYAQSLTPKPVKAILTGPITLVGWSYLPEGVSFAETVLNLAEALGEEVAELERAGFRFLQIDEPALLEKMPLRTEEQPAYLELVREAFWRTARVGPGVQVHLHLCYSDYAALRPFLEAMEPDVVSLEAARQDPRFLEVLSGLGLALGPGAFDVHSPLPVSPEEMAERLRAYARYFPRGLWVNPDCGLKTRTWPEVEANLRAMVEAAQALRSRSQN
ncbi:5-methyltetrahydropteroyltriglutamate--homocysteine S-methyltransferase [Meiothermus sp. QL-1]|uniref:5-methyltetrahydropteroyltriglutamate-- homocysteine S-methyltransferase n=1 Tax=Meiothermus sp. QL-1 TaxID=2058095 RepID=UPI000E0C5B4E|nr:5-methyltetrahydropteroyltriglutamate--homocysteine S-methyltransferase [Meiothermus sp. QL-1]RDI94987.1 5-methyltetrahydropteroyltriglutamate--homocysteine S-methyltransferase [Meiothermus sp. QL-1]